MSLTLRGVSRFYARLGLPALDGVNLTVARGRITALAGASGSGKTTLLRLIAGFERPDLGSIFYKDECYADKHTFKKPQQRSITMIFQDLALFPHLTARENVRFGMKNIPPAQRGELFDSLFAQVNLVGYEEKYPHELSGGQRQRVAVARALGTRADIILMDEPFSNLDSELKWALIDEIRSILSDAGKTVIFVTHDKDEAFFLADDIAVLEEGKLLQRGAVADVFFRPSRPGVARFFGPVNGLVRDDGHGSDEQIALLRPELLSIEDEAGDTDPSGVGVRDSAEDLGDALVAAEVDSSRFMGSHYETRLRMRETNGWRMASADRKLILYETFPRTAGVRVTVRIPIERARFVKRN